MKKRIVFIPIVLFVLIAGVAEFRLLKGQSKQFDFGGKFWIHRGGTPENSIEGIGAALNKGFLGVEVDVFYLASSDQFVLTHDWPPAEPTLTLEKVLKEFENTSVKFWLDHKNSNLKNFLKAKNRLEKLTKDYNFENRLFIESHQGIPQLLLSWTNLNTTFWVRPFEKSRIRFLRLILDRWVVGLGNFISVSMPKEAYPSLSKTYTGYNLLLFTVNEPSLKESYLQSPNIKVILTDLNRPEEGK